MISVCRCSLTSSVAAVMLLVVRPTAQAQNPVEVRIPGSAVLAPRDYQPAAAPAGPVSLADAVRSTMLGSPAIALQAQEAERTRGQQQEATGAFDDVLLIAPGVSLVNQPITPAIRNGEIRKRKILGIVADAFDDLYHTMRTIAENTSTELPVCPSGIRFDFPFNALERTDKQELQLLGTTRPLFSTSLANVRLDIAGVDVSQICSRDVSNGISAEILKPYWNLIDFSGGLGINGILTSAGQIRKEAFLHLTKITESVGSRIRLNFERLGPVPTVQLQRDFTIETSFNKFLRNGIGFDASLRLHSEEFGFGDKIMDPNYGGFDLAPFFPSTATGTLTVPLGKGQGSAYVAAPERAATVTIAAQQERLRHTVAEDTFRTVLAYLNLISSQQTVVLLNESLARRENIVRLTDQRVAAGDLAQVEAARARARQARVAAAVDEARADLTSARMGLAEAMGIEVREVADAPMASDQFPSIVPPPLGASDLDAAAMRRHDLRMLEQLTRASAILTTAAAADLRKRLDLQITGGFSNLYESPFNRFLPDELDPIYSDFAPKPIRLTPTRYYNPLGLYRSLSGRWEPFVAASFTIGIPFGNNTAKGRLAQAEAGTRSDQVQANDLRRTIGQSVTAASGTLTDAAQAWSAQNAAVAASTQAVAGALQRFQAGEITLFDLLVTEDQLTTDQLERLRHQQEYFSILARLRFETGEIVSFDNQGSPSETVVFRGGEFVFR